MARPYSRVLLKLSGESLIGTQGYGVHPEALSSIASQVRKLHEEGIELGLVIGGGNIFRGIQGACRGMDRSSADQMGMLATAFNGLALQQALDKVDIPVAVMSAFEIGEFVQKFNHREARKKLSNGEVLLFVGGTGQPFLTTDTGAALRACQIKADILLKGTKVDGVYSDDPIKNPKAKKFDRLSYQDVLEKELKFMDPAALVLCRDSQVPIRVFKAQEEGEIYEGVTNQNLGTVINQEI